MKIRRIDFSPDEWLAGTLELSNLDRGTYITVCALIYSRGGPVTDELIKRHCIIHGNALNASLKRLAATGKIIRNGAEISQKRCENELETAQKRLRNASENGVLGNKIKKVRSATRMNGAHANHQPSTINYQKNPLKSPKGDDGFEDFWQVYPHKVGKGAAERSFKTARKVASLDALLAGIARYKQTKPDDRPWCNPSTWLAQRRWEDQPATSLDPDPQGGRSDANITPEERFAALQRVQRAAGLFDADG